MYVRATFHPGGIFHVYNRGVAKQPLFHDQRDYKHFLETLSFYLEVAPMMRFSKMKDDDRRSLFTESVKYPLVQVLAYCLMPNHFHLVLREEVEGGVSTFMRRAMNSYTRAYNTRYRRVGTVFQGTFSAVVVESDEQLLHLTRYVHLNPYVARLCSDPAVWGWSSYPAYLAGKKSRLLSAGMVLDLAQGPVAYKSFVVDYASYAQDISRIKSILIDPLD